MSILVEDMKTDEVANEVAALPALKSRLSSSLMSCSQDRCWIRHDGLTGTECISLGGEPRRIVPHYTSFISDSQVADQLAGHDASSRSQVRL